MHSQQVQTSKKPTGRPSVSYQIGGGYLSTSQRWKLPMKPIRLQRLFAELGIKNEMIANRIKNAKGKCLSRSTISSALNRGIIPEASTPDFKAQIEAYLKELGAPIKRIKTCWEFEPSDNVVSFGKHVKKFGGGIVPAPKPKTAEELLLEKLKEPKMLTPTTLKLFGLFRNPFIDDVQKDSDVFMSESHHYSLAAMLDAANNGGLCAVVGECGAGKSVLRRKMIADLQSEGRVRVIFPQTIDKQYLTSNQILEAIVNDLSPGAKVRRTNEAKARQVRDLLLSSSQAGMRHVLLIEEAHDLSVPTMKQLKRLWEIEDGFKKVLGIVLIGQPELAHRLNIQNHPEMREMILRCLQSELLPLDRELEAYVALKFQRVGKQISDVFADGWSDAVRQRLAIHTAQGSASQLFPLYVHNLLASAMNEAAEIGVNNITPEIIGGV